MIPGWTKVDLRLYLSYRMTVQADVAFENVRSVENVQEHFEMYVCMYYPTVERTKVAGGKRTEPPPPTPFGDEDLLSFRGTCGKQAFKDVYISL